jgi:hypothetical protein
MASLHLRVPDDLDAYLSQSARQLRRSKNEIAAQMLEESRRLRLFPGIGFRGTDWARRPYLVSAGLDVWEAVSILRDYDDADAVERDTPIRRADIELAEAYARRFPDEIEDAIAANSVGIDALAAQYPTFRVVIAEDRTDDD